MSNSEAPTPAQVDERQNIKPQKQSPELRKVKEYRKNSLDQISVERTAKKWWVGFVFPAFLVGLWQVIGLIGFVQSNILPTPLDILTAFKDLIVSGELVKHIGISVYRAFIGFLLGGGLGLASGLLAGLFHKFEESLDPSIQMLRTVPHLAITPLFILWFGIG